jgi:hypothetical protein
MAMEKEDPDFNVKPAKKKRSRARYKPGRAFSSIEEMLTYNLVYVRGWKRATSVRWISSLSVAAVNMRIKTGEICRADLRRIR